MRKTPYADRIGVIPEPPGENLVARIVKESAADPVNHPAHYTQGGIECIDALDAAVTGCPPDEAVCVANVIKYVWRYKDKDPVRSLEKARWYLDRLIGKVKGRKL